MAIWFCVACWVFIATALIFPLVAQADTIDIHLMSKHSGSGNYNENNLGIGIVNQVIPGGGALRLEVSALNSIYFTVTGREL